jgi:hypothetical protein
LAPVLALLFVACAPGPTDGADGGGERVPCVSQTECDAENRRVCASGFCSDPLPTNELQTLYMRLRGSALFGDRASMRIFILYPVTPNGTVVTCANLVDKVSVAELLDPTRFNLTTPADARQAPASGDTIVAGIVMNGVGRVIYVEIYPQGGGQGTPTGVGCKENIPYVPGSDANVAMDVE